MNGYKIPRDRTSRERKLNKWLLAWVGASAALFIANLFTSPNFLWSLIFIALWTVIIGSYALKTDRHQNDSGLSLLEGNYEEQLPEIEYPEVERKWRDSDFV